MSKPPPSRRSVRAALVALAVVLAGVRIAGLAPFQRFEDRLYDTVLVPLLPAPPTTDRIAIIEVDDRTLSELGQRWPLDRRTWATFLRRLASYEPAAVAADVVFDQPSQEDVRVLAGEVRRRIEASPEAETPGSRALLETLDAAARELDSDQLLAEALAAVGNVTLGVIIAEAPPFPQSSIPLEPIQRDVGPLALDAQGVTVSTARLFLSARSHGAMNVLVDEDGVVRRYPYMISKGGHAYASLALAIFTSDLRRAEQEPTIRELLGADRAAPYLRFRPQDGSLSAWPRLSFSDVLYAGGADVGELLRGRYVFVGATAPGILDLLRTPVAWGRAGVEVHATALENLLARSWLERDGAAAWLSLVLTLVLVGGFAWFLETRARARAIIAAGIAVLAAEVVSAVALAAGPGLVVALVPVPVGLALIGAAEGLHRWVWGRHEQERLASLDALYQAERAGLERLRAVVEHVGDAIVSVDAADRISWMNPAAERLFHRRAKTAVNRPVSELVPHFLPVQAAGDVLAGDARVGEQLVPVEATATKMEVGGERYTNFVFRDVAARKASERARDEFIAGINHELRTPLTSILGSLKLMSDGVVGEVPEKVKELLEIAEKNGELLLSLVSDLLDAAKIDAGRLVLQLGPIGLALLLSEAAERHGGFASRYDVHIEALPVPAELAATTLEVDKERVIQVLGNLVSNAVKHSPTGGVVRLAAGPGATAGRVRIAVIDQGPGIASEFHDQVFERFSATVAGDGRRRAGTGLGLAIARGIVEAHRGEIGFDSELGRGAAFWFELATLPGR